MHWTVLLRGLLFGDSVLVLPVSSHMVSCFQSICKRCPASLFWGLLPFCIQESGICLDFLQGFFCPALPFPPFAGNPPSISQHLILYFPARKRSSFDLSTFDEGFFGVPLSIYQHSIKDFSPPLISQHSLEECGLSFWRSYGGVF